MTSTEYIQQLFKEQVGRPIDAETAKAAAELVGDVSALLAAVPAQLVAGVEPSTVFGASYAAEGSAWWWLLDRS